MRKYALIIAAAALAASCTFPHPVSVELIIPEEHPFEAAFSETMWFTLSYFDGKEIIEKHVPKGRRRIRVAVRSGSLSVFSLRPIGELGALGGFFEPGDDRSVMMLGEYGSFAEMLLRAASFRPEAVGRLSMESVLDACPDLQAADEISFMEDIFNGTLSYGITENEEIPFTIDSLASGSWIPERYDLQPIDVPFSGRPQQMLLYPGVYRYAEASRNLLLILSVSEDGSISHMITAMPSW